MYAVHTRQHRPEIPTKAQHGRGFLLDSDNSTRAIFFGPPTPSFEPALTDLGWVNFQNLATSRPGSVRFGTILGPEVGAAGASDATRRYSVQPAIITPTFNIVTSSTAIRLFVSSTSNPFAQARGPNPLAGLTTRVTLIYKVRFRFV
jgi:hypothetical protein